MLGRALIKCNEIFLSTLYLRCAESSFYEIYSFYNKKIPHLTLNVGFFNVNSHSYSNTVELKVNWGFEDNKITFEISKIIIRVRVKIYYFIIKFSYLRREKPKILVVVEPKILLFGD